MTVHETATGRGMNVHSSRGRSPTGYWWCASRRSLLGLVAAGILTIAATACGGIADEGKLPPEVPDPKSLHTAAGALARYRSALAELPRAFDLLMTLTGVLTD